MVHPGCPTCRGKAPGGHCSICAPGGHCSFCAERRFKQGDDALKRRDESGAGLREPVAETCEHCKNWCSAGGLWGTCDVLFNALKPTAGHDAVDPLEPPHDFGCNKWEGKDA